MMNTINKMKTPLMIFNLFIFFVVALHPLTLAHRASPQIALLTSTYGTFPQTALSLPV